MKNRHHWTALAGAMVGLMLGARAAHADAFTYASARRQVRAGIIVSRALDVGGLGPLNSDPHVFHIADARADMKPTGLEFVNPIAPPVITTEIYQRWDRRRRGGATDPSFATTFRRGARVTKNMGAYWEVDVDELSAEDLRQFDILYLHSHKENISFPPEVREKLRRFADGGGTLWIENCGGMTFDARNPFLYDIQMNSGANASSQAVVASPNHPLLTYPFILSPEEARNLGDKGVNAYYVRHALVPDRIPGDSTLTPLLWNTLGYAPVSVVKPSPAWRPLILAGAVGAGRVVISAAAVGCAVNDRVGGADVGYGGNSGAVSGTLLRAASVKDLKFLYNLATWSTAHQTANANGRHFGASEERAGQVLADKFKAPTVAGLSKSGSAVFHRNVIYAIDGALVLHCFDARPGQDLDGDGNRDDGLPDLITGLSYDEVWRFDLKTVAGGAPRGASTPTVIEFYDPNYVDVKGQSTTVGGVEFANFNQRELVVVTLSDGSVVAIRALPRLARNTLPLAPATFMEWRANLPAVEFPLETIASAGDVARDLPIPSPTWAEGVLLVAVNMSGTAGPTGRIVAIDPRHGLSAMRPGPTGTEGDRAELAAVPPASVAGIPPFITSPTVGLVKDNASGALDRMVYVGCAPVTTGAAQTAPQAIRTFWFGSKAEPLTYVSGNKYASRSTVPWFTRTTGNDNPLLLPRVFYNYRAASGAVFSRELEYDPDPTTAPPAADRFKVTFDANQGARVLITAVNPPNGDPTVTIGASDPRQAQLTFYGTYTLDWATTDPTRTVVNARNTLPVPDVTNGGSSLGGPPALSPEDLLYWTVTTAGGATNPGRGVLFALNEQSAGKSVLKWAYTFHNGFSMPTSTTPVVVPPRLRQTDPNLPSLGEFLYDVQFFGTPAYREGVVYAAARATIGQGGTPVSVLCAFKANPEFVIRLNTRIDRGAQVRIRQLNPVKGLNVPLADGTPAPGGTTGFVDLNPAQYTIDHESGLIRIHAFAPVGTATDFISASLPFLVTVSTGGEQVIAGQQVDVLPSGRQVRLVGAEGVDNLLWYAVLPPELGAVSASPSLQGDVVWLGFQTGWIASLPADPQALDPQFQARGAQVLLKERPQVANGNFWRKLIAEGGVPLSAPTLSAGILAANTPVGLAALEDTLTLIADSRRILEVNAGGEAVWSSDGTRSHTVAGGELPVYVLDPATGDVVVQNPGNVTGVPVAKAVPFSRPTVARRTGINEIVVVDTGNNRVVQIDRGGNTVWEVHRLFDDYKGLLRPGDPTTLSEPTDVSVWTEFQPGGINYVDFSGRRVTYPDPVFIVHYLIADTGNFRVIELVDVFDRGGHPVRPLVDGNPATFVLLRQVNFASNTYAVQGKKYRYRSVQRVVMRNSDLPAAWQPNPYDPSLPPLEIRSLTLAAISNYRLVGGANSAVNVAGDVTESGGGSLVVLNEAGTLISIVSNLRIPDGSGGFRLQPITNPTWFSKFDEVDVTTGRLIYKYLLADENGCYQMRVGASPAYMDVEWMLSAEQYYRMTGKRLRAASIQRLTTVAVDPRNPNRRLNHFLITSRFSGEQDLRAVFGAGWSYNTTGNPANGNILGPSAFSGEVFELNPLAWLLTGAYQPDYLLLDATGTGSGPFVWANPNASIVWRSPTEEIPRPGQIGVIRRRIGEPGRATSTAILEQPAYADRPF